MATVPMQQVQRLSRTTFPFSSRCLVVVILLLMLVAIALVRVRLESTLIVTLVRSLALLIGVGLLLSSLIVMRVAQGEKMSTSLLDAVSPTSVILNLPARPRLL